MSDRDLEVRKSFFFQFLGKPLNTEFSSLKISFLFFLACHMFRTPKSYVFNLLYGDRGNCLCSPDYSWNYNPTVVSQQRRLLNPGELSHRSGVWHWGLIILKLVITRILKFLWIKCNFSNVSINSGNGGILVGSDISHIQIAPHWLLNYSTCLYE